MAAGVAGAVWAAIHRVAHLDAVTQNPASALPVLRRQLNCGTLPAGVAGRWVSRTNGRLSVELAERLQPFGRGVSSINQEKLSKIPAAGDESRRPGRARGGAQRG